MKKMTYIIIGIVVVAILIIGVLVYKNTNIERECRKEAEQTRTLTARVDKDNATEESYYHCLVKKGVDPHKYKWQGKEISERTREYIESMSNFLVNPEKGVYGSPMNISDGRMVFFPNLSIRYIETFEASKKERENFNKEMEKDGWTDGLMLGAHQYFEVCEKNSDICEKIDLSSVPFHRTDFKINNLNFTIKNGDGGNIIIIKN